MNLTDEQSVRLKINFIPIWRFTLAASGILLVIAFGFLLTKGLNRSIHFEGGAEWTVPVPEGTAVGDVRAAVAGLDEARIQLLESSEGLSAQIGASSELSSESERIAADLAEFAEVDRDRVLTSSIGPTWGSQITSKAIRALVIFFIVVAGYLAWRLEWRMALGALLAVVHDLALTAGMYSIFGFEVSPSTVIALLTILGYSLYDTVVVFDKVIEIEGDYGSEKAFPADLVNRAMNQVVMRSINTTITTVIPVLSMLVIGGFILSGGAIVDFALALLIGLLLGTYSSLFLAAPLLVWLRRLDPEQRRVEKVEAKRLAKKISG